RAGGRPFVVGEVSRGSASAYASDPWPGKFACLLRGLRSREKDRRRRRRLRIDAAAPSRTRCPNCISVFEKALKSYADNPAENVITPVLGTTFGFLDEAYDFYNL
uniref:Uncharacterized protein n=4 Tax=Aegilops tauschii subsp. strangulata TaxID=200361 RepID=A0A453IXY6_AEGTS